MLRRFCLTLDLQDEPALIKEYEAWHRDVWPEVLGFHEEPGLGLRGNAAGHEILIGSSAWLRQNQVADLPATVRGTRTRHARRSAAVHPGP